MIRLAEWTATVTCPVALAERLLQALQPAQVAGQLAQLPLLARAPPAAAGGRRSAAPCRARRPRRSAGGPPGRARSPGPRRASCTTCLWTWLSAGTSTTTSPSSCAWQDSRRLAADPRVRPDSAPRSRRTARRASAPSGCRAWRTRPRRSSPGSARRGRGRRTPNRRRRRACAPPRAAACRARNDRACRTA